MEDREVFRLIFLFLKPNFFLILFRWKSIVLSARFMISSIAFVFFICWIRFETSSSVDESRKNLFVRLRANGDTISFRF